MRLIAYQSVRRIQSETSPADLWRRNGDRPSDQYVERDRDRPQLTLLPCRNIANWDFSERRFRTYQSWQVCHHKTGSRYSRHFQALTASATARVQKDILQSLKMDPKYLYRCVEPFNRTNLYYEVSGIFLLQNDRQLPVSGEIPSRTRSRPTGRRQGLHTRAA